MKQLVQEGVDYWFYLSPKVYVTSKENIFLYHTESGARLEVTERHLKDLLQAVYEPKNLGVVEFPQELWEREEVHALIEQMLSLHRAGLIPIDRERGKPNNFLPILNLQALVSIARPRSATSRPHAATTISLPRLSCSRLDSSCSNRLIRITQRNQIDSKHSWRMKTDIHYPGKTNLGLLPLSSS